MLFKRCVLEAIARGEITLAFRWKRPTVSSRARLRTAMGEVQIGSVRPISDAQLTEADARKAGFSSLAALARWDAFNSRQGYHREILDLVEANTGAPARKVQARRAQAEGAGSCREPRGRLSAVPARGSVVEAAGE